MRVHTPAYIEAIEATAGTERPIWLDPDTCASSGSYQAALLAAGAACMGVDEVLSGRADSTFPLVRPPGHHAEPDTILGFCLFNNIAIGAAHALAVHGLQRILILDPDVHHGNGTQAAFYDSDKVLYVSTHRHPFYPGTGWFDEVGVGKGAGYTFNVPLPYGTGDADILYVYHEAVAPIVRSFQPELIMVSAGFDTHMRDPLGGFQMTEEGYAALYALFLSWAEQYSAGRIFLTLEGGYNDAALVDSVRTVLGILTGAQEPSLTVPGEPSQLARQAVERAVSSRPASTATG